MAAPRIGLIGAGQMAQALAAGFVRAGLATPERIVAADPAPAVQERFRAAVPGARLLEGNPQVVENADVVFLATKPQVLPAVFEQLRGAPKTDKLFVSIAAGVTLARLAEGLGSTRIIRVMPNTPCLIGRSAAAYALGLGATPADADLVEQLLRSVGYAVRVEERLLDAVTGLSGSGPAFVYLMIEALADGGVRMGLPRDTALALAAHTVRGAAEMVLETGQHPSVLKDQVASPGGTTIAGLALLEERATRGALIAAVEAAARRSVELGK